MDTDLQKQRKLQKANLEQYAEGEMRGAAPGKKTWGLQQKSVEVKTKKNKQKTLGMEMLAAPARPLSFLARRESKWIRLENEETFMNRVEVKVKILEKLKP